MCIHTKSRTSCTFTIANTTSISYSHFRAHTHTQTHMHTFASMRVHLHAHTFSCTRVHSLARARTHILMHACALARTLTRMHTCILELMHIHVRHTWTYVHTRTIVWEQNHTRINRIHNHICVRTHMCLCTRKLI